jgi:hypothetical protein
MGVATGVFRRRAIRAKQRESGVIDRSDAVRMARGDNPKLFGIDPSTLPESMPDLEEERRSARRRAIARRRGRMSTILTAGTGPAPEPLGG